MGMDLNLVQLIAYTDWNETQQKQADGKSFTIAVSFTAPGFEPSATSIW